MKKKLTQKTLENLKPAHKRKDYWDTLMPGFCARVSKSGRISFAVTYRYLGRQKKTTLGHFPIMTLAGARNKACIILRDIDAYEQSLVSLIQHRIVVRAVAENFIELYAKRQNKDWKGTQHRLNRNFTDIYGAMAIEDITRMHIHAAVDKVMARGAYGQANRVLSVLKKFFNWSVERGYIENNPASGISPPAKEIARDRVLSDDELMRVWVASDDLGFPFGPMFLLLILTGQRRGEVSGMKWSEVCFDTQSWSLPGSRSKNGRAHSIPLCPMAINIIKSLPRFLNSDLMFTTTGTTPVSGFGKYKLRIDKASGVREWRLHDIRRTAASGMARLGVAPHVVERILNHSTGAISGVAAVYNRYGYEDEKREALNNWSQHIEGLNSEKVRE